VEETKVIIMRGLPGSGKSTYLAKLDSESGVNNIIVSADRHPGLYDDSMNFNHEHLRAAHEACFSQFHRACEMVSKGEISPEFIAVDNTNLQIWEMTPYEKVAGFYGIPVEIHVFRFHPNDFTRLANRNNHKVPTSTLHRMIGKFELTPYYWSKVHKTVTLDMEG